MALGVKLSDIVPYTSVFLDCSFLDILFGLNKCTDFLRHQDDGRGNVIQDIQHLFVTEESPAPALVCLSARSAFDLYLRVCAFPPGSEVIFSAINIPDMAFIARQHELRVIPCDVDMETLGPRLDLLEELITASTVAVVVAHVFGRWFDISPVISLAQRYRLRVIEDCAEAFCGWECLGDVRSDLVLFSFGPIKFFTAFGGGVAKVRDRGMFNRMEELHEAYDIQSVDVYLKKLVKCAGVFCLLDVPAIIKPGMFLTDRLNIDHKRRVVEMLRGFPNDLIRRLRHRPPTALLEMMLRRFLSFDSATFWKYSVNGQYIWDRLPDGVMKFGGAAVRNNFWLFPVLVENPKTVALELNRTGIDAYIGASQLSVVEPELISLGDSHDDLTGKEAGGKPVAFPVSPFPTTAKFFMDHVIYLPVNWTVSPDYLERISVGLHRVVGMFCSAADKAAPNLGT
ncbi:hypothetical protein BV898_11655 [Hypsibius exemplaris]|uniref:DegT/DnrJ/EryC1/StrS aminotransferase family protein n=1 Tax=Hypsibius exemplaris TaxID=2072580 RepID=A0A1W0WG48_HYPEX|nr:hypothetical protein BV898_11655 [Hypsibius exemplaris]